EGRGRFYEEVGAIRDVVQNHMLQVVGFLAMEPPAGGDDEALHNEQVKVFRSIRPLTPGRVVRGQFRGYRDERTAWRRARTSRRSPPSRPRSTPDAGPACRSISERARLCR